MSDQNLSQEAAPDPNLPNAPTDVEGRARGKRKHQMISSYTILLIITVAIGIATMLIARVTPEVTAVKVSDIRSRACSTASRSRSSSSSSAAAWAS